MVFEVGYAERNDARDRYSNDGVTYFSCNQLYYQAPQVE